jgi:microcin C transport system substrate-binding protein
MIDRRACVWLIAGLLLAGGCGSSDQANLDLALEGLRIPEEPVSLDKDDYPVFPAADSGADPAVPASDGGAGFTGEGWTTNREFDLIGDPHAVRGGTLRQAMMTDFPTTLRYRGPNVTAWNQMLHSMVYETLLSLHPTSLEYIPSLATHWQISEDQQTFRFRINPNARWSDGSPVVAEDVVETWKLSVDPSLQDPGVMVVFSNFEEPVAESKYIVSVRAKTEDWQNFLNFSSGLYVYPAHVIRGMTGEAYIRDYNYTMLPGSGPYIVREEDIDRGNRLKITRRQDHWAEDNRNSVGLANFDAIEQIVVRDRNLEFEMFKRGDIDYYYVQRASQWVDELDYENIQRGLNQKRKIFNHNPQGVQGIAMNTRRAPFDDIRVRKALRHLFNREAMVESLMYNEYLMMDSMYPGSIYENPDNDKIRFDPETALDLLGEAGWDAQDSSGRLVRGGVPLSLEITYYDQSSARFLTVFQEDLRRVGITLNLRQVTWETLIKLLDERSFDMVTIAYTGSTFPNPEATLHSSLADQDNSNNITGFRNERADQIIAEYKTAFDLAQRVRLLQELDGLVTDAHHWILEWTAPYERVVYWNKFGQPLGTLSRIGDYRDIPSMWWIDPARTRELALALEDSSLAPGAGPTEERYWLDFVRAEEEAENPVTR